jgi:hypothetical protein
VIASKVATRGRVDYPLLAPEVTSPAGPPRMRAEPEDP